MNASASSNVGLSQDQYIQLISLLQQANLVASASSPPGPASNTINASHLVSSNISAIDAAPAGIPYVSHQNTSWLIDSGANEHICCNVSGFSSFYRIRPVRVSLPIGNSLVVYYAGIVSFTYSPVFRLNLISVAKLRQLLSCSLHLSLDQCLIQNNLSLKMIGLAKQVDGLYRYSPPSTSNLVSSFSTNKVCNSTISSHCNSNSIVPSDALWHFRLGHLSHSRLQQMHTLYPFISINKRSVCDLCHFAKHKHLPFPSSHTTASKRFELIHFDIWGPISISSVHGHRYFLTITDIFGSSFLKTKLKCLIMLRILSL
jgi:hypothetical protein